MPLSKSLAAGGPKRLGGNSQERERLPEDMRLTIDLKPTAQRMHTARPLLPGLWFPVRRTDHDFGRSQLDLQSCEPRRIAKYLQ
jgi:hypothetical protein